MAHVQADLTHLGMRVSDVVQRGRANAKAPVTAQDLGDLARYVQELIKIVQGIVARGERLHAWGQAEGRCRSTGPWGYVTGSSRAFHSFAFGYFAGRVPRIARPSNSPRGAPSAFMKAPKLAPCAVRSPEW
jgi:hypothetical protein